MYLEREVVRPLLLDGALGTELIARGLRVRQDCPESWNLDRPDEVRAIHLAYAAVGSEIIQTNTFGATRPRLARFGQESRQREIIRAAVGLARAAGRQVWGSLGPTGETLPLSGGDLAPIEHAFAEAAALLAEAGVDAIHLETQFHAGELEAAIRGARSAGKPVIASMTLMPGISGLETPHGVPVAKMIRAVELGEPDVVGVNCSVEAERMRLAVETLRDALPLLPVIAKPQAKLSDKCATGRSSESPETFARHAAALIAAGVAAIGGCCGIGPAGIAAIKAVLDREAQEWAS